MNAWPSFGVWGIQNWLCQDEEGKKEKRRERSRERRSEKSSHRTRARS